MHKGKKHTESSYQPIKNKDGKVILTSEQARNVDEDFPSTNENSHEFDHKPAESEIEKAKKIFIAFREAETKGFGVVSLGSKMIDPPVVKRALHTINLAIASNLLNPDWKN